MYYSIKKIIISFVALLLVASCSTSRRLPFESFSLQPLTKALLVDEIEVHENLHKYTQISRFTAEYSGQQELNNFKGFARIAQDSMLMLSLSPLVGGELLRIGLSPDSSRMINRLDKVYSRSSYDAAAQILPLPYPLVEALLAYRFSPLIDRSYQLSISEGMYHLEDKKHTDHYTSFKVDANFLVRKIYYKDFNTNAKVEVSYLSFIEKEEGLFPQDIEVHIQKRNELAILRLTIKKVDYKEELSFPFQVSSRYVKVIE